MRRLILGTIAGVILAIASLAVSGGQATAAAAGCDDYAIMRCGATSPAQFITKAGQNAPGDLKAVYADFGLVPSEYGKFAASAKPGTLRENGDIVVGGVVVGRSTLNVGRVHDSNFNQRVTINGKDYWGGSFGSTYHANTADVMVMFNDKGVMQFAIINSCGNPQRITPYKPVYSCDNLRRQKVDGTKNTYEFTTAATATRGAEFVKAVYDFGDGQSKTVTNLSQAVRHSFTKDSQVRVTVYVRLPGGNVVTTSSPDCVMQIKFEQPPSPSAQCSSMQVTLLNERTRNYRFVVTAQFSSGVRFKSADIDFGDTAVLRGLVPNGNTVTVRHAYGKVGSYTARATLHFTATNGQQATANCEATITPTTVECKPGIPQGSADCETPPPQAECVPTGKGDNSCELTNTGPGTIIAAVFGGASTVAGVGHYLLRRRLLGL